MQEERRLDVRPFAHLLRVDQDVSCEVDVESARSRRTCPDRRRPPAGQTCQRRCLFVGEFNAWIEANFSLPDGTAYRVLAGPDSSNVVFRERNLG